MQINREFFLWQILEIFERICKLKEIVLFKVDFLRQHFGENRLFGAEALRNSLESNPWVIAHFVFLIGCHGKITISWS